MRIMIFSCFWGIHKKLHERYAYPSIKPSIDRLTREGHSIKEEFCPLNDNLPRFPDEINEIFTSAIDKCVRGDMYLFLLMPDTMYGSETFYNVAKYAEHRNIYVAWPHYRFIWEDVYNANIGLPKTNVELMSALWPYPHQTTKYSNMDLSENLCKTRQSSRTFDDWTVVNHGYPTIYFFKPDNKDHECWKNRSRRDWIWYDTGFFGHAVGTNRCRVIGSAEFAFCGEMEKKESHNSVLTQRDYDDIIPGRGDYSNRMLMTAYCYKKRLQ